MSVVFAPVELVRQRQVEDAGWITVHPLALHFKQLYNHIVIFEGS